MIERGVGVGRAAPEGVAGAGVVLGLVVCVGLRWCWACGGARPVCLVRGVGVGDLAGLVPGPGLGAALAGLDRGVLNGYALVEVLVAQARQVAHEQARLLADLVEVAHCLPGDEDGPVLRGPVGEFAADEIRAALCLTRRAADVALAEALDIVERLPQVHAALLRGDLDLPRARVFSAETMHVGDDLAVRVVGELLGVASGLTTGQLAGRLRRRVLKADPDQARRRAQESVRGRRVFGQLDPDGTSSLGGERLPADRAAAAMARIGEVARARHCTGDPRTLDQLRADTYLDLLLGIIPNGCPDIPGTPDPAGTPDKPNTPGPVQFWLSPAAW